MTSHSLCNHYTYAQSISTHKGVVTLILGAVYALDLHKLPLHAHDDELRDIWDTFSLLMNELS